MKFIYIILFCLSLQNAYCQLNKIDPKPFLPEVFSKFPNVRDIAISPDMNAIYFTVESFKKEFSAIFYITKENGFWSTPKIASFSGRYKDLEPFFTPDGQHLFFASARPLDANVNVPKDIDIWYVTKNTIDLSWSEPINPGKPVNSEKDEFYPSVASSGNLYFTRASDDKSKKEDIFISEYKNGEFANPYALSDSINSDKYEFNAFVAPDESFIIYTSYGRPDDMGGSDLYISYNKHGSWGKSEHLGARINSPKIDYCPFVDIENQILYFTSERSQISTYFEKRHSSESLDRLFNQYSNGLSRLYFINIDTLLK